MTPADLRSLLAKATPGPWHVDGYLDVSARHQEGAEEGEPFVVASTEARNRKSDADLVVAAVNALPALLAATDAAERLANDILEDSGATQEQYNMATEVLDELTKLRTK